MRELPCKELVAADGKRTDKYRQEDDVLKLCEKASGDGEELVHATHSALASYS